MEGHITTEPRGDNGFGYDPHLMLPEGQTSAELTPDEKTDDPIADKLVALALALGQPDGPPR